MRPWEGMADAVWKVSGALSVELMPDSLQTRVTFQIVSRK